MQTEELVRHEAPRDVRGVSPALQDLAPPDWRLTTARGKRVPLSSAGYVLHFGQTYRLRLAEEGEAETPPEVRLVGAPSFVSRTERMASPDCLTFRVHHDLLRFFKGHAAIRFGDLEIECSTGEGADRRRIEFTCPVVVRIRWGLGIVVLLMFWALLTLLYSRLQSAGKELISQGPERLSHVDWWDLVPLDSHFWLWLLGIAALAPLGALLWHIYRLRQRSAELEARYRHRLCV